ncbi:hypothetical protein [Thiomicrorhabdus sp.]|uniref:hypothetical protein n=1 Tax=Thiomicrorhabdus sp. TaxID=2039724 RepID=UPI0029C7B31D|nr:hypothetical protein [Thiomicrorhabdus sp.]
MDFGMIFFSGSTRKLDENEILRENTCPNLSRKAAFTVKTGIEKRHESGHLHTEFF